MKKRTLLNKHRWNCAPTALWLVSGHSEETVIEVCLRHGWNKHVHGMRMYEIREAARELGIIFTDIYPEIYSRSDGEGSYRYMTLGEFCRSYRTGVYLVSLNAHLAVVNFGVVVDPNYGTSHLRRRVYAAYRIENSTMTPLCPPRVTRDPLIKFVRDTHTAHPKKWNDQELRYEDTGIAKRYEEASTLVALNTPVRLSSVLQRTSYRRADFLYDLRHGNIVLEEE